MMDKDEIITLSSDEESDFVVRVDKTPCNSTTKEISKNQSKVVKSSDNLSKTAINQDVVLINISKKEPGELMDEDILDCTEQPVGSNHFQNEESTENYQNHSKPNIVGTNDLFSKKKISTEGEGNNASTDSNESNTESGTKSINSEVIEDTSQLGINKDNGFKNKMCEISESSNQNLKFFTEFVEFCGSLEDDEVNRAKLTKKLMKRYGEAECTYIKSEGFRGLIQSFRDRVTKNNLYIIAKEVSDELTYRKKLENDTGKTEVSQRREQVVENLKKNNENEKKGNKKQTKVKKIIAKLDKLGLKIRELEEREVDLSDEEESTYVQLQRYRERFYQIYTKLCKFTNELSDLDRIYNRKICFTESKYPEINKCIEKWLNKTKRFPDFSDIMKLLESQSSLLGLPPNKEAIRAIAIEIFQQVGSMLQRKRGYDLWDSLSGYLNDEEDPATKNVALQEVFKKNFEIRVKKEQEIFQHYAELQEKQRLEPEEVPDEEANRSPAESENEDEEEIQNAEELLNKRLDVSIAEEETEGKDNTIRINDSDQGEPDFDDESTEQATKSENTQSKGSKNNYKNCKSLRWRTEKGCKTQSDSASSEDSNTEQEKEKKKQEEVSTNELINEGDDEPKSWKDGEDDSDLELISVENVKPDKTCEIYGKMKEETKSLFESPSRRPYKFDAEEVVPKKKMRTIFEEDKDFEIFEIEDENDNPERKKGEVIDVHYCQIFSDNVFDELEERKKDWGKRKVFRDLTNLNRFMELHGKKRKSTGLFSSTFFHRKFCDFDKSSWKKKFKFSFRSLGSWHQKCALNEEKSGKTMNSDSGGDSDEKDIQNNSERRGDDEGNNFFSGQGNGSEGDNNEDENKKNGRTDIELNEAQHEEEEEEEEDESSVESAEHSLPQQKTEEQVENKTSSESVNEGPNVENSVEEEQIQRTDESSETPHDDRNEAGKESTSNMKEREQDSEILEENLSQNSEKLEDKVTDKEAVEVDESKPEGELEAESSSEVIAVETEAENSSEVIAVETEAENSSEVIAVETEAENSSEVVAVETEAENSSEVVAVETEAENSSEVVAVETEAENGSEVIAVEKPSEDIDVIAETKTSNQLREVENKSMSPKDAYKNENIRANSSTKITESHKMKTNATPKTAKPTTTWKSSPADSSSQKLRKRTASSTSDEEIVKRFLLHSPSSISITPPRKLSLLKSPSQAALQALATLRNLKGISATIVRGKPKDETIESSNTRRSEQSNQNLGKRGRRDFPVFSKVQNVTPKIVNVSGNVSSFDNSWPGISNTSCDSSNIRISNVWGSLPNNFMQSVMDETITPGCSSQKNNPGPSNTVKKKNAKKPVEYVVLD